MTALIVDNKDRQRFELTENGHLAFARYAREEGRLVIPYVEAAPALRGSGAAGRLMEGVVAVAKAEQRRIAPICGYAAAWLRRHPEYAELVEV